MNKCPICAHSVHPEDKFCSHCGVALSKEPLELMRKLILSGSVLDQDFDYGSERVKGIIAALKKYREHLINIHLDLDKYGEAINVIRATLAKDVNFLGSFSTYEPKMSDPLVETYLSEQQNRDPRIKRALEQTTLYEKVRLKGFLLFNQYHRDISSTTLLALCIEEKQLSCVLFWVLIDRLLDGLERSGDAAFGNDFSGLEIDPSDLLDQLGEVGEKAKLVPSFMKAVKSTYDYINRDEIRNRRRQEARDLVEAERTLSVMIEWWESGGGSGIFEWAVAEFQSSLPGLFKSLKDALMLMSRDEDSINEVQQLTLQLQRMVQQ